MRRYFSLILAALCLGAGMGCGGSSGSNAANAPDATPPKGGLKGGRSRAATLTSKQRSAIAKKAALARWRKP